MTLSTVPAAIRAAATTYIELIVKESDNNIKVRKKDEREGSN